MVGEWNEYKLPKCKHRAWKAWKEVQKSRRIRQDRLESLQNKLDHLQNVRVLEACLLVSHFRQIVRCEQ